MIKAICLLISIYLFSMFYNYFISYLILLFISNNIYNNIIISLIILVQIDNYILFLDLNKIKLDLDNLIKENERKKNFLKIPKKYIKSKTY